MMMILFGDNEVHSRSQCASWAPLGEPGIDNLW